MPESKYGSWACRVCGDTFATPYEAMKHIDSHPQSEWETMLGGKNPDNADVGFSELFEPTSRMRGGTVVRFQEGGVVEGGGMFTRRHYYFIANIIDDLRGLSATDHRKIGEAFASAFAKDNSRFDRERFLKAAGVE